MTVKKFKRLRAMFYTGIALVVAAMLILWCAIIAGISDNGLIVAVIVTSIALAFIGCALTITYNVKVKHYSAWQDKNVFKNVVKYDKLPYIEIDDYAKEIELVRNNFAADIAENKNQVSAKTIKGVKRLSRRDNNVDGLTDVNVVKTGKIYYAYAVDSILGIHAPESVYKYDVIKVLYSPDPYFDGHPEALDDVLNNLVDYEGTTEDGKSFNGFDLIMQPFLINHKISTEITGGRDVYLTSAVVERRQLPTGYVANNLLPIIVSPENNSSAFVVDCRYWGDNLAANFAYKKDSFRYAQYNANRIANFTEHTCGDYAQELKNIRKNYTSDKGNQPIDLNGENPFPKFSFSNMKFYYAYILDGKKTKREGVPYICIYSTDKYFAGNPQELKVIAQKLQSKKEEAAKIKTVLDEKRHTIKESRLPTELTDGRQVIMTVIFANKNYLPLLNFSDNPVPAVYITEGEDEQGFLHLVDCKYWSNGFTYEYVNAATYLQ